MAAAVPAAALAALVALAVLAVLVALVESGSASTCSSAVQPTAASLLSDVACKRGCALVVLSGWKSAIILKTKMQTRWGSGPVSQSGPSNQGFVKAGST